MKKSFVWGARIISVSIIGVILSNFNIIFPYSFLNYFISLFFTAFIVLGFGFITKERSNNFISSNVLGSSLILAGLSLSVIWILFNMYSLPLNNPILTVAGAVFLLSVLGSMFGGLSFKN